MTLMVILAPLQWRFSMKDNKMPELKPFDMVELFFDEDFRYVINNDGGPSEDEGVYRLNEDDDIELESVTRVWRQNQKGNYILIWEKTPCPESKVELYLKDGKYQTDEEMLEDNGYEDVVIYKNPNYDGALIGVTDNNIAVYDFDKMVESLMREDGLDEIEAIEWIEYNTMRANPYFENAPIIMYPVNYL